MSIKKTQKLSISIADIELESLNCQLIKDDKDIVSKVENKLDLVKFDAEEDMVTLKYTAEIVYRDTFKLKLVSKGVFHVEGLPEENKEKFIKNKIETIGHPLISDSSLIIAFTTDKMIGNPLVTPPNLWEEEEEE